MNSPGVEIVLKALDRTSGGAALSATERERASRFRFDADRRRFIAAHETLRQLLGARCGLAAEALQLEYGSHGKPRLAGGGLQFSLSRSGELAAYAFARDGAVGIDIEAIRPLCAADALAARAFPTPEFRQYATLLACERLAGFFRGWTRTEALAKALGGGLTLPREALEAALEEGWRVCSFTPAPGFAGAVAWQGLCP